MTKRIDIPGLTRREVLALLNKRRGMVQRCHNPDDKRFSYYGARGIVVCDEWRKSGAAFVAWAMQSGYVPGLEIDRRNGDGPYHPDNCRWVTHQQNACNRRKRSGSATPFKDVKRNRGKWAAMIFVDGRDLFLGTFANEEDAARAYDRAALAKFGEFARLNFAAEESA